VSDLETIDAAALEHALEQHRVELNGYCYRMLGSSFEAEDAVQEAFVRAWRGFDRFEGRSSLRSWLYRIATNVCYDLLEGRARRALPMDLGPSSGGESLTAAPRPESEWVLPMPDDRVLAFGSDPADAAAARDTVRLAFVAALQHLSPRQRAVLILRDVLRWQASEVAELLDATPTAIHSVLQRARATLAAQDLDLAPAILDGDARALLDRYVDAFERYDIATLVSLLREDATMTMPPNPQWFHGVDAIHRWWVGAGAPCRLNRVVPVASTANGAAAFGLYRPSEDGGYDAFGIQIVEVADGGILGIHSYLEPRLFPLFGLPPRLAGQAVGPKP
jgi:RNA polymerase sigma-70 factor, ECF subfamily